MAKKRFRDKRQEMCRVHFECADEVPFPHRGQVSHYQRRRGEGQTMNEVAFPPMAVHVGKASLRRHFPSFFSDSDLAHVFSLKMLDIVRQVDGAGGEESYFVVTDSSKVRVEGFLLFDQGSPNPFQPEITSAITREHCVPRASAKKLKIPGTANGGRGRGVNSRRTPEVQQPARRQGQWLQGFSSKFWAFLRQHHVIIPVLALCLIIFGLSCAPNTGLR